MKQLINFIVTKVEKSAYGSLSKACNMRAMHRTRPMTDLSNIRQIYRIAVRVGQELHEIS
jgi:hypothetical protein